MDYCDIKCALCKKGYTLTRVARELGLAGPQAVQQVCMGKYTSTRVEIKVSEITGIPLAKLFPTRYCKTKFIAQKKGCIHPIEEAIESTASSLKRNSRVT